jgi:arylsulfatase A-like enzyme
MCRSGRFKYVRRLYEKDEFYDLQADPGETVNRIDDPVLASEVARHKERLLTFFLETGDVVPHDQDRR